MKKIAFCTVILALGIISCIGNQAKVETIALRDSSDNSTATSPLIEPIEINPELPTIGLLMYDGVLESEVIATSDVFAKPDVDGNKLFNVVAIAPSDKPIRTEEGMIFLPDFSFENAPKLTALFVPSSYDMDKIISDESIVSFVQTRNKETTYTVSNCAGAQLIGASGVADGHKIVTWIGGGEQLQKDYPDLIVQDDVEVSYIEDGKFSSSNGNLASYISALNILEKMTSKEHRKSVEDRLYIHRLKEL